MIYTATNHPASCIRIYKNAWDLTADLNVGAMERMANDKGYWTRIDYPNLEFPTVPGAGHGREFENVYRHGLD